MKPDYWLNALNAIIAPPVYASAGLFPTAAGGNTQSNAKEFAGLGLALGVVRGVRAFKVDKLGRLTGVHYPQVWIPGENVAECKAEAKAKSQFGVDENVVRDALNLPSGSRLTEISNDYSYRNETRMRWLLPTGEEYTVTVTGEFLDKVSRRASKKPRPAHDLSDCACGFYGYYEGSNDYYKPGYVTGVVEGWGEALIGTRGFRVSKAKIVALYVPPEVDEATAFKVSRNYLEVPQFSTFGGMVTEFEPDGGEHAVSHSTDADDFWTRSV